MTKKEQQFLDAATSGDLKTVEALVKAGVDVDVQDSRGCPTNRTALMHAADNGHLEVVDFLLKADARVNAIDKGFPMDCPGGNTALILAIQKGHLKIAHRLLDAGASSKTKGGGTSVINAAAYLGDEILVKRLLDLGANPKQRDGSGREPIVSAVLNGKMKTVKLFLDLKIDPNTLFPGDISVLRWAASHGNLELCELLINCGANPDFGDPDINFTPLMAACSAVQKDVVKFLLSLGVASNKQDTQKRTALDIIRRKLEPEDISPEFRQRMIDMGNYEPKPIKKLKAIETMLLKAGAKTSNELGAKK